MPSCVPYKGTLYKPAHVCVCFQVAPSILAKVYGPINTGFQRNKMFFYDIIIQGSSKKQLLCRLPDGYG